MKKTTAWGVVAGVTALTVLGALEVQAQPRPLPGPGRTPAAVVSTATLVPSPPPAAASPTPQPVAVTVANPSIAVNAAIEPTVNGTAPASAALRVEAQTSSGWQTLTTITSDAAGRYQVRLSDRLGEVGRQAYRVTSDEAGATFVVDRQYTLGADVEPVTAADLGASWHSGCPVGPASLRAVNLSYLGFDWLLHRGTLIVHEDAVKATEALMQEALDVRFPLRSVKPVSAFGASDEASAEADNSSAFNCRAVTDGTSWSAHAYGRAIDLNDRENPYDHDGIVVPTNAGSYLDRSEVRPGMLEANSALVTWAQAHGWTWLDSLDPQHFERTDGLTNP